MSPSVRAPRKGPAGPRRGSTRAAADGPDHDAGNHHHPGTRHASSQQAASQREGDGQGDDPDDLTAESRSRRAELLGYLAAAVGALLAAGWMLRLWQADLRVPFFYSGNDSTAVAAHFKTVLETGWYEFQPDLAAPAGQQYHDFPTADNLHLIAARLLGLVTSDFAVAMNGYFLIGFPLAAITAVYFLRVVGVSRLFAAPLAVLYATAPYHLLRNEGHLWLASYYPVPLALVVVWRVAIGDRLWGVRSVPTGRFARLGGSWGPRTARLAGALTGRGAATAAALALVATASSYYAVFTLILLAAAGLTRLARTGDRRRFRGAVLAGLLVVVVMFLNMLPDLMFSWANGANSQALSRDGAASEIYALKISSLLLPAPGHPIPLLSAFRVRYDESYPVPSESPALGLIAAIGLIITLLMMVEMVANAVRQRTSPAAISARRERLRQLVMLVLVALLFSTVGGVETLISFVTPVVRGWNRMAILIALLCLAVVGLVLDGWMARRRRSAPGRGRWVAPTVAAALLVVGVADQSLTRGIPPYQQSAALYGSDQAFVHGIQALVPAGSMIFQLPYVPFPESPSVNQVADADQLKLYLNSTTVRWSAGGIRGRPSSDWPSQVTAQPVPEMLRDLAVIGFAGVTVDRERMGDAAPALEAALAAELGPPTLTSPNGRYTYSSLAPVIRTVQGDMDDGQRTAAAALLTDPVMAYPGLQFNALDRFTGGTSYHLWRTRASSTSIPLVNDRGEPATVHLTGDFGSFNGAPDLRLTVGDVSWVVELKVRPGATGGSDEPDPAFVSVDQIVTVPAGGGALTLEPGPRTQALNSTDPVIYAFQNLHFVG